MKFMPYADDVIWLLFGLGLALIAGGAIAFVAFRINGWAFLGFVCTGILVAASYYVIGSYGPKDGKS